MANKCSQFSIFHRGEVRFCQHNLQWYCTRHWRATHDNR